MSHRLRHADRRQRHYGELMPRPAGARGFTLTELVMVIVIIGILAVIAAPRFMGSQAFRSRGFYDEAQAVVRYAQKVAIAQRRTIFVCVSANEIRAATDNTCAAGVTLPHPLSGGLLIAPSPGQETGGVTLATSAAVFSFNGLGQPTSAPVTVTFNSPVAGDPVRQIIVEAETGYVRRN